jgi:hypothetical protein
VLGFSSSVDDVEQTKNTRTDGSDSASASSTAVRSLNASKVTGRYMLHVVGFDSTSEIYTVLAQILDLMESPWISGLIKEVYSQ